MISAMSKAKNAAFEAAPMNPAPIRSMEMVLNRLGTDFMRNRPSNENPARILA